MRVYGRMKDVLASDPLSLDDVIEYWECATDIGLINSMSLDEYVRTYFVKIFNSELDMIGYEAR